MIASFAFSLRLVQDFITPTLLVGLFKPPEELSALVVMELLYYYALAHQDSFDVRWIKVRHWFCANVEWVYGVWLEIFRGRCRAQCPPLPPPTPPSQPLCPNSSLRSTLLFFLLVAERDSGVFHHRAHGKVP